ncbi:hypothetical protein OBBRIDRAFT_488478 [Obba rivulosa]|uniref:Uncharacterized protein n=1 Tax=Obba rivulosa TaxID=1052685 RepID=A0A8E2AX44_9APHY|nr:hypothetical protein OBBRIDRAFT_488478 [Obba rivulosa]
MCSRDLSTTFCSIARLPPPRARTAAFDARGSCRARLRDSLPLLPGSCRHPAPAARTPAQYIDNSHRRSSKACPTRPNSSNIPVTVSLLAPAEARHDLGCTPRPRQSDAPTVPGHLTASRSTPTARRANLSWRGC